MYKDTAKVYSATPNAFLLRTIAGRKPGRALDIGMGQGRNAIWLAGQGWDVTGIDVSDEGLAQGNAIAKRHGLRLRTERVGYAEFNYGDEQWDLIVLCYFLPKDLPPRLLRALKPGGLVVVEGFHAETGYSRLLFGGFADNELPRLFNGYRTLQYEDLIADAEWGGALGEKNRVVRLLAQKPAPPPDACQFDGRNFQPGQTTCWGAIRLRCETDGWRRAGSCENNGKND
jgi:SAM-dependent methyltransferase